MLEFPLIAAGLGTIIAAYAGRLLASWFDRIQTQERDEFETRITIADPPNPGSLGILLADLSAEVEKSRPQADSGDQRAESRLFEDLESRLSVLEADREAAQRDFAIQREYHALGLAQSKISFTLGYVFGALGAIVILAGAVKLLFFSDGSNAATIGVFTAIAGAIPEALAGLLFVSASKAGSRMSENFDRGREDRDLAAAQEIAASMEDRTLGNRLQAVLALSMAKSTVTDGALRLLERDDQSASSVTPNDPPTQRENSAA
jgi:TRADD-N domain-containing protein